MTAAEQLLLHLSGIKKTGRDRWMAHCPAHDDSSPSLSIRELDDGRVLLKCFAGCEAKEVAAAIGLGMSDLYPKRDRAPGGGTPAVRRPFAAGQLIELAAHEAGIAAIVVCDLLAGKPEPDVDRLLMAAHRLASVKEAVHG